MRLFCVKLIRNSVFPEKKERELVAFTRVPSYWLSFSQEDDSEYLQNDKLSFMGPRPLISGSGE